MSFVYIAGPYQHEGKHDYSVYEEIDRNISNARKWAARLATEGIPYFSPHMNSAHMEVITPSVSPGFWVGLDNTILQHAAAILLLDGWQSSEGARHERIYALDRRIPTFYTQGDGFDDLVGWWSQAVTSTEWH